MSVQGWVILFFAGLGWLGCYAFACYFWPFARCPKCEGRGSHPSPSGRYWRACRKCKGVGRRERTGLKIWKFIFGR